MFRDDLRICRGEPADIAVDPQVVPSGLATLAPELSRQFTRLLAAACSTISVLIFGETGTGKEVAARAVHAASNRSGPFVAVNCGAIPSSLVEAELFGARKGAYSGAASDRIGLVRASDHGTLFLDEIGELQMTAQVALLRVLQEREVMPVGAVRPVTVDLRVIAATHRDIDAMVEQKAFREDLVARLRGFTIRMPALRERREDLGLLIAAIVKRIEERSGVVVTFSCAAGRALTREPWLRNIRQLEQWLTTAATLSGGRIGIEHLPIESDSMPRGSLKSAKSQSLVPSRPLTLEEEGRRKPLIELFAKHQGSIHSVARELGKDRVQIRRWIKLYAIDHRLLRR